MADSLHQALLEAAKTVIEALSLDGLQERVHEHDAPALEPEFVQSLAHFPCIVLSANGLESEVSRDTCAYTDGFPLVVRILDRAPAWDVTARNQRLKWREDIKRALRGVRLSVTYTGSYCLDVMLLPSPTYEEIPQEWQLISSPLAFQLNGSQAAP